MLCCWLQVETIGDSYMVVANITMLCNDHVDQLLNFAIGMHHAAARVHDKQGQPLKIRVGECYCQQRMLCV